MTFKLFNYMTTQINGKDPKQQERKQELKYVLQKYIFQIIIWNVSLWNMAINSKYHSVNLKLYKTQQIGFGGKWTHQNSIQVLKAHTIKKEKNLNSSTKHTLNKQCNAMHHLEY